MAAKNGDTVRVHYTGTLEDGTVFDSSKDSDPLEATLGEGMLLPGFENAIVGLEPGGKITIKIPAAEAYGEVEEEYILTVPKDDFPQHLTPEIGMQLQITGEDGEFDVLIIDITDTEITLDANHPLAGENLTFDIELVSIQ